MREVNTIFSFYLSFTFPFPFLFYQRGGGESWAELFLFLFLSLSLFFHFIRRGGRGVSLFFSSYFTFLCSFLFSEAEGERWAEFSLTLFFFPSFSDFIVLPCQLVTQSDTALCQNCQTMYRQAYICQVSNVYCVKIITCISCQSKPSWSLNKISKLGKIVRRLNRSLNSWLSWSTQWGWSTQCLGQLCHWQCFISREGREILRRSHFWDFDHLYMLIYLFFS